MKMGEQTSAQCISLIPKNADEERKPAGLVYLKLFNGTCMIGD